MIFLWGLEEDDPMAIVHNELRRLGANIFYLDHRDVFNCDIENIYTRDNGHQITLKCRERALNLNEVKAAYIRPYNFRNYKEMKDKPADHPLATKAAGFERQLMDNLEASDAFIVNKMLPAATNHSKPLQLSLIRRAGFKIPETFITNDSTAAADFLDKHAEVVFKSISGVRSIVEKISPAHRLNLDDVQWCPTLFQKVVPGHNYRVHVIKNELFALRIESDKLDYRYGKTTMEPAQLPADIAAQCIELTASIGLHFSGIDLMRTPDDEWYCFEVNPSPAYSYFQLKSGIPIGAALAKALMDADK